MTCTCGHTMEVDAESREEAVMKLKGMMDEVAIAKHISENHKAGEPVPSVSEVHAMIEQTTKMM